jgi:hypothetical protein
MAVAGGGGDALVRKRARGPVMQLRCEAEKVMGGLVWAMWGRSGASTCGWLAGVGGWGGELRGPRVGFYGHERERMAAWARATGEGATRVTKTGGAAASLSPASLAVAPAAPAAGKC